jgi:hypothetical protein
MIEGLGYEMFNSFSPAKLMAEENVMLYLERSRVSDTRTDDQPIATTPERVNVNVVLGIYKHYSGSLSSLKTYSIAVIFL